MKGDDRRRFCEQCSLHVYDISAMSKVEAVKFLTSTSDACVRFYRRADGTIMTQDCPVGLARLRGRVIAHVVPVKRVVAGICAAILSLFSNPGNAESAETVNVNRSKANLKPLDMSPEEAKYYEKSNSSATATHRVDTGLQGGRMVFRHRPVSVQLFSTRGDSNFRSLFWRPQVPVVQNLNAQSTQSNAIGTTTSGELIDKKQTEEASRNVSGTESPKENESTTEKPDR